ncbi:hypothetical protein HY837_05225 [archaeon]|nr:hypothetical protein [archaeon]
MFKKTNSFIKKHKKKLLWATAGLASFAYHAFDPTFLFRQYYWATDSIFESKLERKIEEDFKIDIEGDDDITALLYLHSFLREIQNERPELLEHIGKIIIIPENVSNLFFVEPFKKYGGRAFPIFNTIELRKPFNVCILAHEAAHTKYFETSSKDALNFNHLFKNKWYKDLHWYAPIQLFFSSSSVKWRDESCEPRHGFMSPTGALSSHENIAEYVDKFYLKDNYAFWKQFKKQDFSFDQAVNYLLEEKFISQKQHDDVFNILQK